jgi:polar amino acid transport system ATP-binding protein
MHAAIEFRDVHKSFGGTPVLRGLDLRISRAEKLAIIGPSGSGKSTILRVAMALESIEAGSVEIDGEVLWRGEPGLDGRRSARARRRRLCRKVGMVFQHFNLFPHLTVLENLVLAPRRVLKLPLPQAEERALALLESVGLGDKASAHPAALSGGQKQRVAIARALALEPEIMLFDEVTSALDPELVGEVLGVLRQLAASGAMTMVLVTHQMGFAREIADRVVFVDGGRVVEEGAPDRIFSQQTQPRTREFLRAVLGG